MFLYSDNKENLPLSLSPSSGPVLSLAMTSSGEQCFSGGIDSTIQWWNIPSSNVDPYDTYGMHIHAWEFFNLSPLITLFLSLHIFPLSNQIPMSWQDHGWAILMLCGDWLTAASRTASFPAQPMERSNCGTHRRKLPASALST